MKHPFLFITSLIIIFFLAMLGWDFGAELLTMANTAANLAGALLFVVVGFVDYRIFKFSIKKFIKS